MPNLNARLERLERASPQRHEGESMTLRWIKETLGDRPPNTPEEDAWAIQFLNQLDAAIKAQRTVPNV